MTEQPTVTEPKEKEKTSESADSDILAKLKELDISDPKKLDNMAMASSQAGKLANELGTTRLELAQVKEYLATLQTPQQNYDFSEGIDVGSVVRKETKTAIQEYMKEFQENQRKGQEAYFRDMGMVQNDRRYPALKTAFDKHMQSFNVQQKISLGQTTASSEYSKIKDAYMDILEENLKSVGTPKAPVAPHVESNMSHTVPMPTVDEDRKEKIKNRTDPSKGWSGTDENITDLVKDLMAGDSIFKY